MSDDVASRSGASPPRLTDVADFASLLNSASTVACSPDAADISLRWTVDHVCAFTGWPVGHIYMVDEESGDLEPTDIWHVDDEHRFAAFVDATKRLRLHHGEGLPGRIVASGEPSLILDLRRDGNFPRADAAEACGLVMCFGFPIVSSRGVEGVMEFLSDTPAEPTADYLELVAHVGRLVGHLLDQVRSREALERSEARLAEAQRLARLGSWSWDIARNVVVWSDELYRIYGIEAGQPIGFDSYRGQVHPDERDWVAATIEHTLHSGEPYEHEYRLLRADGEVRWVAARGAVVETRGHEPLRLGGYCQDITAQREAEARNRDLELELSNQERILERIARGEDLESTLNSLCRVFESRYPGARCSILQLDAGAGALRHAAAPSLPQSFRTAIDGLPVGEGMGACGTAAARNEMVVVEDTATDPLIAAFRSLATEHDLRSVWSTPLRDKSGQVNGTFAVYRSTTHRPDDVEVRSLRAAASLAAIAIERRHAERAATAAARLDALTGLPNRAQFLESLEGELREPASQLGVLFCDLDRFKWINDSLGHPSGDRILVEVADRLRAVMAANELLARFGGDEFSVLVTNATPASVADVAARVDTVFDAPFHLDSGEFFLSVSIGIAMNDHEADAIGLVRDADAAMYAAKDAGRARFAMFDEELRHRAVARVTLESDLRRGIERREFVLHFQPVRDFEHDSWSGVEALARWHHPTRGLLGPDQFIPLAEETGLIIPLGLQILELAAAEAAQLAAGGISLPVAANLSVVQLTDPHIAAEIESVLQRAGVPPGALMLEITESAIMAELDIARATLHRIVEFGVAIVIDDFGTGYSSIARLGELPVAGLKIDQQFTRRLGSGPGATRVFAAITDLAHALDLRVVAEGIETAEMLDTVRALRCEGGQGYHLARPVQADELPALLLHGIGAAP